MMTCGLIYVLCLLCSIINISNSQYMPLKNTSNPPGACDDANGVKYVEHFFNVIFSEFHSNQPVCVCVQMCADQPTYCYPNGCLKKTDSKKKINSSSVTHIDNDDSKSMFLVDEKNNFAQMVNAHADETYNVQKTTTSSNLFTDTLKDMYKTVFKYKKMPKVELRYNLREQVKNMKSDLLRLETDDISKTRWPKLHHRIFHDQKVYANDKFNQRKNFNTRTANYFFTSPEKMHDSYQSKYFKRELRRNDNVNLDSPIEKKDEIEKDFSIETLIENLIGNTFEVTNAVKPSRRDNVQDLDGNLSNRTFDVPEISANDTNIVGNETFCIISMNDTNEIKEENKYTDQNFVEEVFRKWRNYTFGEMITELSKRIDEHNNTSLEMMKHVSDEQSLGTNNSLISSTGMVNLEIVDRKAFKVQNTNITGITSNSTYFVSTESASSNELKNN